MTQLQSAWCGYRPGQPGEVTTPRVSPVTVPPHTRAVLFHVSRNPWPATLESDLGANMVKVYCNTKYFSGSHK